MSNKILDVVKPGVVTGKDVQQVFAVAKQNEFAIPAVKAPKVFVCSRIWVLMSFWLYETI